jgi:hypothetical protein
MTPKISLVTAVAGAALVLAVPAAWGKGQAVVQTQDQQELSTAYMMAEDGFDRAVATKPSVPSSVSTYPDANERAIPVVSGVSTYLDANERGGVTNQSEPGWLKALRIRGEGLDKMYGLGDFASTSTVAGYLDANERAEPPVQSTPISVTTSGGGEIEWPQVGIGLGIGIVLMLGLFVALRATRIRPLAH